MLYDEGTPIGEALVNNYRVYGALKEDGSLIDEVIVALSETHATQKANAVGVLVNRVQLIDQWGNPVSPYGPFPPSAPTAHTSSNSQDLSGVRIPILISAILNIVVGLGWMLTLIGIVFAIPLWILSIFEFMAYSKLDGRTGYAPHRSRVSTLAILEILTILVGNVGSMICGIISLINGSKLR